MTAARVFLCSAATMLLPGLVHAQADFATAVHPILASHCAGCHGGEHPQAGLSFDSREAMLKGGRSGPAIVAGDSAGSLMVRRITGAVTPRMPMGGAALSAAEIAAIRQWIDSGAVFPKEMSRAAPEEWNAPLAPRRPAVPEGAEPNAIDRFVAAYFAQRHIAPPAVVDDDVYLRRVSYDITGLPPEAAAFERFRADRDPDKRTRMARSLLAGKTAYAENWISFWNDLLRNDEGVNYAGMRKSITGWLYPALDGNLPYDRMVATLVNPVAKDDPDGFLLGVNWRGDVNASQTPYMQAAQNTAQIFLGINLKCASCHDSFINRYKLKQSYGMAAMFAPGESLELVRCDVKMGVRTDPEFVFPELGAVPRNASLAERRAAAARLFTSPGDGRLARTMVNRMWQRLMGRGLVEPVDDMDARPWNPDLLDWLASDFAAHGYDLKYLLLEIVSSKAYQTAPVAGAPDRTQSYEFRGPQRRRLTAEQFMDTVSAMTGEWRILQTKEESSFSREWRLKSTALTRALGRPIRDQVFTTRNDDATTLQALELMNGETLAKTLRRGARRLLGELPPAPPNRFDSGVMHKGVKPIDIDIAGKKQLWLLMEDAGSYDPSRSLAGWSGLTLAGPKGEVKLASIPTVTKFEPRSLTVDGEKRDGVMGAPLDTTLVFNIDRMGYTRLRGEAVVDDSGKRDDIEAAARFFVFTEQPDRDELVRVTGAPPTPAPAPARDADSLIDRLFLQAMGRRPDERERALARDFLLPAGAGPISESGLEDLLWSLLVHPETQYID